MRVIIPAAGVGSRILPRSEFIPKGLIPVVGRPLLQRTLENLYQAGVEEVVCVSGHLADLLEHRLSKLPRRPSLRFVRNTRYAVTNSIVSLSLTRPWWKEDFCVIDSDVFCTPQLLQRMLASPRDALAVDTSRPLERIDMRVQLRDGAVWHLDKALPPERTAGEFFGVSRWTPEGARHLGSAIDRLLDEGRTDVWYEFAIREAAKATRLEAVAADSSEWVEVDTEADLVVAEEFFAGAVLEAVPAG